MNFIFSIFIANFTFSKVSKYDANDSGSFNMKEIQKLEADKSLLEKLDINKNGRIDGLKLLAFDKDASASFSENELKGLQSNKLVLQELDVNENGELDDKEVKLAEKMMEEINGAQGYLKWNIRIAGGVLLAFFLILVGISSKYL